MRTSFFYKEGTIFPKPQLCIFNHENQPRYMLLLCLCPCLWIVYKRISSFVCIVMSYYGMFTIPLHFCTALLYIHVFFQRVHETVQQLGTLRIKTAVA